MPGPAWSVDPSTGVATPDVLAVLDDPVTSLSVARAAVREARGRCARVHFLRTSSGAAAPDAFESALRALRDETRVPVTFETLPADPARAQARVRDAATRAGVLVMGRGSDADLDDVRATAPCDVLLVAARAEAVHG